jgi:hypothetical protein
MERPRLIIVPSGRPIGRMGMHWTKKVCVLTAVVALAGTIGVGRARADDSPTGLAIAAQAQAETAAAVSTAIAASSAALAQVQAAVPQAAAPSIATMAAATTPTGVASVDTGTDVTSLTTELRTAEPQPGGAAVEQRAPPRQVEPRKSRPRALPQVRGRHTERDALAAPTTESLPVRLGEARRSASGTPSGSRKERRPTAPSRPAPLPPTAPAPGTPGASWSGQGGGQGAFPTPLPAAIAGFLILATAFGFRRVIWWARPVAGHAALTPWRPG